MIPAEDLRAMQGLAQMLWRRHPEQVDVTLGELAYQAAMANADASDGSMHRLWTEGDEAVAWAWLWPPATLDWQVHPDRRELLEDILDWFEHAATAQPLETHTRTTDSDAEARLRRRGYRQNAAAPWMRLNVRDLTELEEPVIPKGFRVRTVAELGGDIGERVGVHRSSWAEFGTRVTERTYAAVMATWPYRSDLDMVLEAPDGRAAAFALGWYDEANRVGELEPVGTLPEFRRRGLGRAVSLFGLHRFRDVGARHAIVACRGDNGYAAPGLLYESVGFRELSRQHAYTRA